MLQCMSFANSTVLVGKSKEEIICQLKLWEEASKPHGFCLSRRRMEYKKEAKFSNMRASTGLKVKIGN